MARILDDQDRFRRAWNDLPFADRRRISKAVNRGDVLDDERDAQLAVMTARRQERFWSWAWLIGPVVSFAQFAGRDWRLAVTGAGIAAVVTGLLSIWFLRKARRAQEVNLPRATHAAGRGAPHPKSKEARRQAQVNEAAGPGLLRRLRRK